MKKKSKKPDVRVMNHQSVFSFVLLTEKAKRWVKKNVHVESWQWIAGGFTVEHRFANAIVRGMREAGLVVL